MFEEIPSPPAAPSQRITIAGFGIFLASFLIGLIIDWFFWSGPMSLSRKITTGEYIVGGVLSAVFLLSAKSATPESNQKRMWALLLGIWLVQLFVDVHQ